MNTILALAAVAVATVASASTNYIEVAQTNHNLYATVREMGNDPELADPAVFRATLEAVDKAISTGDAVRVYQGCSRRCPLTARAVLGRTACFSERVKGDILAVCDYDTENRSLGLASKEAGYANFALQAACNGAFPAAAARSAILNAAIAPARRKVRAEFGSFVGEEGAKKVKEVLDGLAAELNAPRFGKAGDILRGLGMDLEWDFAVSLIPTDEEIAGIKKCLMDGEIPFNATLQNKLCVVLGVEAYNAFVTEYNGTDSCRK